MLTRVWGTRCSLTFLLTLADQNKCEQPASIVFQSFFRTEQTNLFVTLSVYPSWYLKKLYHFTWGQWMYHNGVMTASFVKYPVAHLSDQVLELVCNLAHLIIINIVTFHQYKKRCIFGLCQVVMTIFHDILW